MFIQQNKVCFLTDAERIYTPGSSCQSCETVFLFGEKQKQKGFSLLVRETQNLVLNPPGQEEGEVCHTPSVRHSKDREGWLEDKN